MDKNFELDSVTVDKIENGFVVTEQPQGAHPGYIGKQWVFETPQGLSVAVKKWAEESANGEQDD